MNCLSAAGGGHVGAGPHRGAGRARPARRLAPPAGDPLEPDVERRVHRAAARQLDDERHAPSTLSTLFARQTRRTVHDELVE